MGLIIAVCIVFLVLLGIGIYLWKEEGTGWATPGIALIALLLLPFGMFTKVGANEVGIIYHDRYGVLDEVKYEGFQTKSVFEHITKISTTNKTAAFSVAGQTKDSIYATFMITVVYRIENEDAGYFFRATGGKDISPEQFDSITKEALQSVTTNYDVYEILGGSLETVRAEFTTALRELMGARYYITVVSASFDDIDAGAQIEQAIQDKADAIQQVEIAEVERREAEINAQTLLIQKEAEAMAYLLEQEAKADAIEMAADAEAYKIQQEKEASLSIIGLLVNDLGMAPADAVDFLQQLLYYETWNGVLPEIVTSDMLAALVQAINDQNP